MWHPTGNSILLVARGADPIGTGREVEVAATALAASGGQVHVALTSAVGSLSDRLAACGITVHEIGRRSRPDAAMVGRLADVIRLVQPVTVLSFGRPQAVASAIATRLRVSRRQRPRLVCRVAVAPRTLTEAWAVTRADRVLASSEHVAEVCRKAGVARHRLDTIEPVAVAAFSGAVTREKVAERLRLDPAKIWSLCVAPLLAQARLDRLLWAIDQLGVVRRDVEHVLVGSGPQLRRLRRRARVQHLAERLRIVPSCECLPDLLREVRFVWQSGEVALGGALFDAMAAGKPTVAVDSEAARQAIVDGETGWIVPPLPESEFPRRAFSLIEDDAVASRFGVAAQERAATHFSADRFISALLAAVTGSIE
jgi:glycosyltransferase involved in cell wall biosynthesis